MFHLKRLLYGTKKRIVFLVLPVLLPLIYFVTLILGPDNYSVKQALVVSPEAPIAVTGSPSGITNVKEIVKRKDRYLLSNFDIRKLLEKMSGAAAVSDNIAAIQLKQLIQRSMNLSYSEAANTLIIDFFGNNKKAGELLVTYYSLKLIEKAKEGVHRKGTTKPQSIVLPAMKGEVKSVGVSSLWRPEWIVSLIFCFILTLIGTFILIAIVEWSDSSFKSERQMARYLELPVIGSIPNLNGIASRIDSGKESIV